MSIPVRDQKMLWGSAAGRCSFPKCGKKLVADPSQLDPAVVLGEMAHIIGASVAGPRGASAMTQEQRDSYDNLVLLCEEHHKIVDGQRNTYTADLLRQFKREHEERCDQTLDPDSAPPPRPRVEEVLHSTLLPISSLPRVYSAEAVETYGKTIHAEYREANERRFPPPFIVRGGRLWAFTFLRDDLGPFSRWIRPHTAEIHEPHEMWQDEDRSRYFVTLLNLAMGFVMRPRGLWWDGDHERWYFPPEKDGKEAERSYTPLTQARSTRLVAWQPKVRATGEAKKYWEHLAVSVTFHRVSDRDWVLSLRPERRFTRDGKVPLTSKGTGRRSTSRAAKLYNFDVLEEANFWRSYLSEDKPRIIQSFAKTEALIIDARFLTANISWPGVPNDVRRFANAVPTEDLFSLAELIEATEQADDTADVDQLALEEDETGSGETGAESE